MQGKKEWVQKYVADNLWVAFFIYWLIPTCSCGLIVVYMKEYKLVCLIGLLVCLSIISIILDRLMIWAGYSSEIGMINETLIQICILSVTCTWLSNIISLVLWVVITIFVVLMGLVDI